MDVFAVGQPDAVMQLRALRFAFQAHGDIHFPEGQSANTLRGAFGTILRKLASASEYERTFAPRGPAPSGFADWPRPFVFRASHLDGLTIPAGGHFHFDLNLFDLRGPAEKYLRLAFARFRANLELVKVDAETICLPLVGAGNERKVLVRFLTPTELKSNSKVAARPDFPILAARIRDRISALCHFYGEGAPALDHKGFVERAAGVQMMRCELRQVSVERHSTRTGQTHSIGGFIGEAEYEGPLAEFMPWLKAAQWTGVGRQTVWGKGTIAVHY